MGTVGNLLIRVLASQTNGGRGGRSFLIHVLAPEWSTGDALGTLLIRALVSEWSAGDAPYLCFIHNGPLESLWGPSLFAFYIV